MQKVALILILIIGLIYLAGCGSTQKGGVIEYESTTVTTSQDLNNNPVTTTEHRKVTVTQPEAPEDGASTSIIPIPEGGVRIEANTGGGQNVVGALATINLARLPMYAGIGICLLGLAVGVMAPGSHKKWGITIGITGALMIVLGYLLAAHSMWILIGLGVVAAYGIWMFKDYMNKTKATDEIVTTNQIAKATGVIDTEKFNKIADSIQTKSTVKMVRNSKEA